ncbi:MAG: hypothetical protein PVG03_05145 [Desulfarculaceae bacterium]
MCQRLLKIIQKTSQPDQVEFLHQAASLKKRLIQPHPKPDVIVLALPSRKHLRAILPLHDFLEDVRIILVSPQEEPGLKMTIPDLRFSYVTNPDSDLHDVEAVLEKISSLSSREDNGESLDTPAKSLGLGLGSP